MNAAWWRTPLENAKVVFTAKGRTSPSKRCKVVEIDSGRTVLNSFIRRALSGASDRPQPMTIVQTIAAAAACEAISPSEAFCWPAIRSA